MSDRFGYIRQEAEKSGLKDIPSFTIGVIRAITESDKVTPSQKVKEIKEVLKLVNELYEDESLKWSVREGY